MPEYGVQSKHSCGSVEVIVDNSDPDLGRCGGCDTAMVWDEARGSFVDAEILKTFYVQTPSHVTFYKYAIKAESLDEAKARYAESGSDAGTYVGYVDGDWDDGPEDEWSEDDWVEGHG